MRASHKTLTVKETAFVAALLSGKDGKAAAIAAGYGRSSAKVTACRLLKKPTIKAALVSQQQQLVNHALTAEHVVRAKVMTGDEALEQLTVFARADIGLVLDPADPISKLPADVRLTIKSVTPNRYGRRIELHDSMRATELLAKAGGKLKEIVQVESLEDLIAKSMIAVAGAPA